jgi:hypothetical protein
MGAHKALQGREFDVTRPEICSSPRMSSKSSRCDLVFRWFESSRFFYIFFWLFLKERERGEVSWFWCSRWVLKNLLVLRSEMEVFTFISIPKIFPKCRRISGWQ